MRFLTLFLMPYGLVWWFTKKRKRGLFWAGVVAVFIVQFFSLLPVGTILFALMVSPENETDAPANLMTAGLLPYKANESPQPLNAMHSRGGEWAGRDYIRQCGTSIIAPFSGSVTRGGQGIKDSWDNTYMYIQSIDGRYEMLIMHSDFILSAGDNFQQGQEVGKTNTHGFSSECHEHISLKVSGSVVDPEDYRKSQIMNASLIDIERPSGIPTASKPLKISWYDPLLGGINCDSDCTTMASGTKVTEDRYGRSAACIAGWMGKTVVIEGLGEFTCLDRGGAINEHAEFIWIDLLLHEPFPEAPFGTLIHNWQLK